MTYLETIDYLYGLRLHGMKLGLDTMRALLADLGDPQRDLRFVHVAGTNGKGSVVAMLSSIFTAAGHNTALYTSPHLVSFCERFQINGIPINEHDVVRIMERVRPSIERVAAREDLRCPTFFEVVTAMAALHFAERRVDVVCWETGMGGRLDATNAVTPLLSVITEINLDHVQYLGNTIAEVAREKAGIIKPGIPVVTSARLPEALAEIARAARNADAPLINASDAVAVQRVSESLSGQVLRIASRFQDYGEIRLPLLGAHQVRNCATAVAAAEALRGAGFHIAPEHVRSGLEHTKWPGRFQIASEKPLVILDGAHNPQAAEHLRATVETYLANRPLTLVIGILKDKDYKSICRTLAPLASRICAVPVKSERTANADIIAQLCRDANPEARVETFASSADALQTIKRDGDDAVLVTGSLFLVGEAMQQLGLEPRFASVTEKEMALQ